MSLYRDYLMLNLSEYDSFGGFDFYITIFFWLLAFCICVGVFFVNLKKNLMIRIIKQLFRHGARTEDGAMTLSEIGIKPSSRVERIFNSSTMLRRAVKRVGEKEISYEEYVQSLKKKKKIKAIEQKNAADNATAEVKESIADARFYSPQECEVDAKRILSKRETTILQNVLISLLIISLSACITLLLPQILELLDTALS